MKNFNTRSPGDHQYHVLIKFILLTLGEGKQSPFTNIPMLLKIKSLEQFLNLNTTDILSQINLCCGKLSCALKDD